MSKIATVQALDSTAPQRRVIHSLAEVSTELDRLLSQIEQTQGQALAKIGEAQERTQAQIGQTQAETLARMEKSQGLALAQIAPLASILEQAAANQAEREAAQSRRIEQFAAVLGKLLAASKAIEEGMIRSRTAQDGALTQFSQTLAETQARMESAQERGVERLAGQIEPLALALATLTEETRAALAEARAEGKAQTQALLRQQQESASAWLAQQNKLSATLENTLAGWKEATGTIKGAARETREAADRTSRDLLRVAVVTGGATGFVMAGLLIGFLVWQPPIPKVTMDSAVVAERIIQFLPQPPAPAPEPQAPAKETAPKKR